MTKFEIKALRLFLAWVAILLFWIMGNDRLWQVKGEWSYGTLSSLIADDPEKVAKYDAIAADVCGKLNSEINKDLGDWRDSENDFHVTYNGRGNYQIHFSSSGFDTLEQVKVLFGKYFEKEFESHAKAAGLSSHEIYFQGGGGEPGYGLGGTLRLVLFFTLIGCVWLMFPVKSALIKPSK